MQDRPSTEPQQSPQVAAPFGAESGSSAGWPKAVLAASVVGLPIGWLLCYGALLPFFLGLFFFALFGLVLGAVMYRVGHPYRPLPKGAIRAGVAAVVAVTWATSFLTEAHDFPHQVADYSYDKIRRMPEGTSPAQFRQQAAAQVAEHLDEKYAPGGPVGYVRWAITSSRIDPPVAMLRVPFRASQFRWWWAIRVVLSIVLLTLAVRSQVAVLSHAPDGHEREGTGVNPLSKM